jgi:hypothetical protein
MSEQDAVRREEEMREHEREAAARDPDERDPGRGDASGDAEFAQSDADRGDKPAPPPAASGGTGQP